MDILGLRDFDRSTNIRRYHPKNTIGMLTNLPKAYLGLAIGVANGLTDTLTALALCRRGLTFMAMTGMLYLL